MSAFVYGRIRGDRNRDEEALSGDDKKLVESLVAIIPADVIALHAAVLAVTTTTNKATGQVSITDPATLKLSLPIFFGLAIGLFVIGHLRTSRPKKFVWEGWDFLRMFLPATAFVAWACLTGVSAATPWVQDWSKGSVVILSGVLGLIVLALASATSD